MPIAPERTAEAVKGPRDLVEPDLFDTLLPYVAKEHHVTRPYAEALVGQTLV